MGAITGVIADDGNPLDPTLAERLIAAAPVRGFDGISVWQDGPACLIRHHHATTPQAVGETQPLVSQDGRLVAMLDGRIDNRPDVIATLARADCRDDTSDVALVLALFERFGEKCVTRLVGDWAMAVWNTTDRSLFLARSPLGWRPLVWSHAGGRFGFATDARTLLKGLKLDHAPNLEMVGEFLSVRSVTDTETLWRAVQRLQQGSALRIKSGIIREWHWHVAPSGIDESLSDTDHIDRFNTLFNQAVIATSRCNTVVSAHLSGGLDSSSIVTRAIDLHRSGQIGRPLQAISARFPGSEQDETFWSRAVEEKLGITAHVTAADPYSFIDAHRWVADTYHVPVRPNVFDTSTAAFRLMESQGSRVLLTGEGGDDWMSGGVEILAELFRQRRFFALIREGIEQYPDESLWRRLARTAYWGIMPQVSHRHHRWIAFSHMGPLAETLPFWIRADWAKAISLPERFNQAAPTATFSNYIQQHRYANFQSARRAVGYDNVLAMAERHGVEMRHPLHDLRLAHFFMTAAPRMMKRGGVRKVILREAMRHSLAESVRTRLDKASFVESILDAVLERIRFRPVDKLLPVALGWVDRDSVRSMLTRLQPAYNEERDLSRLSTLWYIISLDIWLSEATDGWASI